MRKSSSNTLTVAEKIVLVEELWDDIRRSNQNLPADSDEIAFVEERLRQVDKSPKAWLTWDQVIRIVKKKDA